MIVGMIAFGATSDRRIKRLQARNKAAPPEIRLEPLIPAAFLVSFFVVSTCHPLIANATDADWLLLVRMVCRQANPLDHATNRTLLDRPGRDWDVCKLFQSLGQPHH